MYLERSILLGTVWFTLLNGKEKEHKSSVNVNALSNYMLCLVSPSNGIE